MSGAPHRPSHTHAIEDEPPPVLGTWRRVYIVVLIYVAFLIAAFYVFTRAFVS